MATDRQGGAGASPALQPEPFGATPDGRAARLYTLENGVLRVGISDFGGRMVRIEAPDRNGQRADVLLGFDDVRTYATAGGAFGALLGRHANRIAGARLAIDGQEFRLSKNEGDNTLHGGAVGFDKVFWTVAAVEAGPTPRLVLTHVSADGDQGFPGEVSVTATYRLAEDSLWLEFAAETSKPTVISLSAHPYFNLAGAASGDVLGHEVTLAADAFLPTGRSQIPTGQIRPVEGTVFDFRKPCVLGSRIRQADEQLFYGLGYDQCFVLNAGASDGPRLAARVRDPLSGRVLEVHTDQPSLQLYTGNKLNGAIAGHGGVIYRQSAGFALEAQGFPDAPHHANFPSTILRPGEGYRRVIRYRFCAT
jgi:aldose 1-epimerase